MNNKIELSDQELREIVKKIAKPTFTYFMKKMQKEAFNSQRKDLSFNAVITIITMALANADGNVIKWLNNFYATTTGKDPGSNIKMHYIRVLQEHLNAGVEKK
jgi:hypothetical protein